MTDNTANPSHYPHDHTPQAPHEVDLGHTEPLVLGADIDLVGDPAGDLTGDPTRHAGGHASPGYQADIRPPRVTPVRIRTAIRIVAPLLAVGLVLLAMLADPGPSAPPEPGSEQSAAAAGASESSTTGPGDDAAQRRRDRQHDRREDRRLDRPGEPRADQGGDKGADQGGDGRARDRTRANRDWVAQRLDQPVPVPSYDWRGWARYPTGRCAWIPTALLERLRLAEQPVADDTVCTFTLGGGDQVRVKWGRPATSVIWDPTGRRQFTQVAGLDTRTMTLPLFVRALPGACQITVNTRSVTSLTVLVWNTSKPTPRCETAKEITALIAHSMIPAAGGSPWPDTPQRPAPAAVADHSACDLLEDNLVGFGDLDDGPARTRTGDLGDTCTYAAGDTSASALLTTGPRHGLGDVRPLRPGATARLLATLPGREERLGESGCAIAVEITPGRVLRTTYRSTTRTENPCAAADLIAGRTVQALLDRTERP